MADRAGPRLVARLGLGCLVVAVVILLATVRTASAHDCSSPGDCEQTGGYNGMIAVVGGIAAVAAAAAAVAATRSPDDGADDTDVGILQVSDDHLVVNRRRDAQLTVTGWRGGRDGPIERVDMPLHLDVPVGCGLTVTPTDDTGELVAGISIDDSYDWTDVTGTPQVTLTASGAYKGQTVTQDVTVDIVPHDVIVVGAGLSGLITALRLVEAPTIASVDPTPPKPISVVLLEANTRIGDVEPGQPGFDVAGRMVRQRLASDPTEYVDLGGQWVGPEGGVAVPQDRMRALAEEFGIEMIDQWEKGLNVMIFRGKRYEFSSDFPPFEDEYPEGFPLPKEMYDCARRLWNDGVEGYAHDVGPEPWLSAVDDVTPLSVWMMAGGPGPNCDFARLVVAIMARIGGSGAFEPDQVSLRHMAFTQCVGPQRSKPESQVFVGRAGQIPAKIVSRIGTRAQLVFQTRVSGLTWDPKRPDRGVTVTSSQGEVNALKVVVAIPPWHAANIAYDPPQDGRVSLGERSPMGKLVKVHVVYEKPFWREPRPGFPNALSGTAVGDLDTAQFVADSTPAKGRPGILTCFIAGRRAQELAGDSVGRLKAVLDDYAAYFGDDARKYVEYIEKDWPSHPYVEGAFTNYMTPGTWTAFGRFLRLPADDMVFWAGTETAMQWPGYFDGAIRAGQQAADDILQALTRLPSPSEGSSVDSGGAGFADPASLGMSADTPY